MQILFCEIVEELSASLGDATLVDTVSRLAESKHEYPEWWVELVSSPDRAKDIALSNWSRFEKYLPTFLPLMRSKLRAVFPVTRGASVSLIYVFKESGSLYLYEGRNPKEVDFPPFMEELFFQLPEAIKEFYAKIHNGWCFMPAYSLGPLPVEKMFVLDELAVERDALFSAHSDFDLSSSLAMFSSGGGSFLCIDVSLDIKTKGYDSLIWWDDQVPKFEVSFWSTIDSWMKIGLEL